MMNRTPNYLVVWDPVLGCTKVSPACLNCFAQQINLLKEMHPKYSKGFIPRCNERELETILYLEGLSYSQVFVAGASDLFHEEIEEKYIFEVLNLIKRLPNHSFQVGTKRSERMMELSHKYGGFPQNLEMFVTVENNDYYNRIYHLQKAKCYYRGLSLEPLLSNMPKMPLNKINAVYIAKESGTKEPRITKPKWIRDIFKQCCLHKSQQIIFKFEDESTDGDDNVSLFIKSLLFQLVFETNGLTILLSPNHLQQKYYLRMLQEEVSQFELSTGHNFLQYADKYSSLMTENPQMVRDLANFVREKRPSYFYE
ncbi:MAG: DUF5131 family protein [Deltaproteobacteria bacterium]|nr:DUF5131 family protein [Deltaproteobacteria bacterium]